VSDIDTAVVDSLKALDLEWPIREADIAAPPLSADFVAKVGDQKREQLKRFRGGVHCHPLHWGAAALTLWR
jgi:hypothetical protein